MWGIFMEIKEGYAYHIKDSYFDRMQDDKLMKNKEAGNYRPTLYCMKDKKMDILWMIPISSQYDKFAKIRNKILTKGKPCMGIVLGEYAGTKAAFLLQNMFPITEDYIDHIHTKNGNPVPVKHSIQVEIERNLRKLLALNAKGIKVTFTDIDKLLEKVFSN